MIIDGKHIPIQAPSTHEYLFVNRKNFHSINVMAVFNSNLKFLNLVAKWPGSSHDAFVFSNSVLCQMFENGNINRGCLVVDSAYPLKNHLLTPVLNPSNPMRRHTMMPTLKPGPPIERAFGILKMRFRCIDRSGGTLLFRPRELVES